MYFYLFVRATSYLSYVDVSFFVYTLECEENRVLAAVNTAGIVSMQCVFCPESTYKVNNTYCERCPEGHTTNFTGSTSKDDCYGKKIYIKFKVLLIGEFLLDILFFFYI